MAGSTMRRAEASRTKQTGKSKEPIGSGKSHAPVREAPPPQVVPKPKRVKLNGNEGPHLDLTRPECLADLINLICFRGRKFSRSRFAKMIQDRIASADGTERHIVQVPVELLALFLAREFRMLKEDQSPINECFELPDGRLLEFVGEHMEAAENIARILQSHDESRLDHVVELATGHDRSWLHTLALEARDARLIELGFGDLDDVERLFAPWHAPLLLVKLMAASSSSSKKLPKPSKPPITAEDLMTHIKSMTPEARSSALERLHFLACCQAVRDAKRLVNRLTKESMMESSRRTLQIAALGATLAGGHLDDLSGPQASTLYRLGLTRAAL